LHEYGLYPHRRYNMHAISINIGRISIPKTSAIAIT
jgi:hypothetical protein